jgi:integrase
MAKLKADLLDDLTIKAAKYETWTGKNPIRDGNGLFLLLHENGSKYFQLRTTLHSKRKLIQLGTYPKLSLSEARALARENLDLIKTQHIDPVLEKKKAKNAKAEDADNTFKKVASDWLEIQSGRLAKTSHKKILQTFNANVYGMLGKYPIKDIDNIMVRNCLMVMQKRGALELMRQTREWVKAVFDFAYGDNLIPVNPITKKDIRLESPIKNGYPHLKSLQDAGVLLRNLTKYRGGFEVATCAYLQLHFAQRPTELRAAKWVEFDLDNAIWTLPLIRSKTKAHMTKPHTIMLSRQAVEALKELKAYTGHSDYLFASRIKDKELSEATVRKCFRNVFTEYHIVPHGCRHTFSTQANESGLFRSDAIETFISHKDKDPNRKTYNQAAYDKERRVIAQWWSDQLDIARDGATVLPFKQA